MQNEQFTVNADIIGKGIELELLVIPEDERSYEIRLDGVMLARLEYQFKTFPNWLKIEGKIDEMGVQAIGDAIETKLA